MDEMLPLDFTKSQDQGIGTYSSLEILRHGDGTLRLILCEEDDAPITRGVQARITVESYRTLWLAAA
jgi:hypothetical protein